MLLNGSEIFTLLSELENYSILFESKPIFKAIRNDVVNVWSYRGTFYHLYGPFSLTQVARFYALFVSKFTIVKFDPHHIKLWDF